MKSYLKLTCEYKLLNLSNAKANAAELDLYGKFLKSSKKIIDDYAKDGGPWEV